MLQPAPKQIHPKAAQVRDFLQKHGVAAEILELPGSTASSEDAAKALGVEKAQIAKSVVLEAGGEAVIVIASGVNRVSEEKISRLMGGVKVSVPNADGVKNHTGFSIGGVPPVGHERPLKTFIDEDLAQFPIIWAAAGTPRTVFPTTVEELCRIVGTRPVDVKVSR
jgi:prolyl-tRNA editing enzyme YbaK/EbsC (Cys-tRNA(Pro) deacylase)